MKRYIMSWFTYCSFLLHQWKVLLSLFIVFTLYNSYYQNQEVQPIVDVSYEELQTKES